MVKNIVKKAYESSDIGFMFLHPIFKVYNYFRYNLLSDQKAYEKKYKEKFGDKLHLDNPKTFNEKINWLKLNDRTPLHTKCADKYKVRDYISEKIGEEYLVPLFFQTTSEKDIVVDVLPEVPCIIKTNHDSGGGIIVYDKKNIDIKAARRFLKRRMAINYYQYSKEWQYKNIKPCIVVEKLLMDKNGNIPFDYKLHCFNGKLVFTQVDLDRQTDHTRNLYDVDWNFIPCEWKYKNGGAVQKPATYEKMKMLAEVMSKDFIYVRVDFYTIENNIFFGELTFHTESGYGAFSPASHDLIFGNMLKLP